METCPKLAREQAKRSQSILARKIQQTIVDTEFACPQCHCLFKRPVRFKDQDQRKFCSRECARTFRSGTKNGMFRGGAVKYRGSEWTAIAKAVRLRDNYRCRRCGTHDEEKGKSWPVDHVWPFREFASREAANQLENLVLLCFSCHAWKTTVAEQRYLKGDLIEMNQYLRSIALTYPQEHPSS